MRIAVFDDEVTDADYLKSIILEWSSGRDYQGIRIDVFSTVKNLNYELLDKQQYDVFFMDIMTPQDRSAGFRASEMIRMNDVRAAIVFTTNSREFIESAFEIAASQYLLKPLDKNKVYRVLDHVLANMKQADSSVGEFYGIDKKLRLKYKDMLFLKSDSRHHRAVIHAVDGKEYVIALSGISFKDFAAKSLPEELVQCHKSYIVNIQYITGYTHDSVHLSYSAIIPVGDDYYQNLIKSLVRFH